MRFASPKYEASARILPVREISLTCIVPFGTLMLYQDVNSMMPTIGLTIFTLLCCVCPLYLCALQPAHVEPLAQHRYSIATSSTGYCKMCVQLTIIGMATAAPMSFLFKNSYLPTLFSGTIHEGLWTASVLGTFSVGAAIGVIFEGLFLSPDSNYPKKAILIFCLVMATIFTVIFTFLPVMKTDPESALIIISILSGFIGIFSLIFTSLVSDLRLYLPKKFARFPGIGLRIADIGTSVAYLLSAYSSRVIDNTNMTTNTNHSQERSKKLEKSSIEFMISGACIGIVMIFALASVIAITGGQTYSDSRTIRREIPTRQRQLSVADTNKIHIQPQQGDPGFNNVLRDVELDPVRDFLPANEPRQETLLSQAFASFRSVLPYSIPAFIISMTWYCLISSVYPNVKSEDKDLTWKELFVPTVFFLDSFSRIVGLNASKLSIFRALRCKGSYTVIAIILLFCTPIFFMCNFSSGLNGSLFGTMPRWIKSDFVYLCGVVIYGLLHGFTIAKMPFDIHNAIHESVLDSERYIYILTMSCRFGMLAGAGSSLAIILGFD